MPETPCFSPGFKVQYKMKVLSIFFLFPILGNLMSEQKSLAPRQPLKYTQAIAEIIVNAISRGASQALAAYAAGLGKNTVANWVTWGEEELEIELEGSVLAPFVVAYRKAEYEAASTWIERITTAMAADWRAAAWLLERRHPKDFGKGRVEVTGPEGGPVEIRAEGLVRIIEVGQSLDDSK